MRRKSFGSNSPLLRLHDANVKHRELMPGIPRWVEKALYPEDGGGGCVVGDIVGFPGELCRMFGSVKCVSVSLHHALKGRRQTPQRVPPTAKLISGYDSGCVLPPSLFFYLFLLHSNFCWDVFFFATVPKFIFACIFISTGLLIFSFFWSPMHSFRL